MKMIIILNIKNITIRFMHVVTNTYATLEAQFIRKLNNTEADLTKNCSLQKKCVVHIDQDQLFITKY